MKKSLPIKLRAWRNPSDKFIVLQDQDSNDCRVLKQEILELCRESGRTDVLVRIVCHELESWFLADLAAVGTSFSKRKLGNRQRSETYRDPDSKPNPSLLLKKIVPGYQKVSGAKAIAPNLDLTNTRSRSFEVFVKGVAKLVGGD